MVKMLLEDGSTVELKGLHAPVSRGRRYVYHRKTGHRFKSPWGSWALVEEVRAFKASQTAMTTRPGTLGALITAYAGGGGAQPSPEWLSLKPRTRRDYETRAIAILELWNDVALERFNAPFIFKLRDKLAQTKGRRTVNYTLTFLSTLYGWAKPRGLVQGESWSVPPLPAPRDAPRANRPWDEDERLAVLEHTPDHLRIPIAIVMFTGLREADALNLPWSVYDPRQALFNFSPSKNDYDLWLAPSPQLRTTIQHAPRTAVTIATTSRGTPWTEGGFRASWRTARKKLEGEGLVRPGLTIHGLRHTVGNALADDGMSTADIARILGHKTEAQAAKYSDRAERRDAATAAVATFTRLGNRTPDERKV